MTQTDFDFTATAESRVPGAYAKRGPVQARHASRLGAESAANRAEAQTARYLALLQAYPDGLTDAEAARLMSTPGHEIERTSINARRAPLVRTGVVVTNGHVLNPKSNVKNTRWQLRALRGNR
jgi:hypothetical protein